MKGELVYLYAFDVANEIVAARVREILANRPFAFELRTDHTYPRDVPLYKPLAIEPPLQAALAGQPVRLLIRVYEVGVVSIAMRVSFTVASLAELLPFHRPVLEDGTPLDRVACDLCREVCSNLEDAMLHRAPPTEPEAYTVFCLTEIPEAQTLPQWLAGNRQAIAELLTETQPGGLSVMQVEEVLRIQRSYAPTDVVFIDWDAALMVDFTGYIDDVLYVLELANLQLEEYRIMDQRLDGYLNRSYEDVKSRRFGLLGTYSGILRTLRLFRVDVTRLHDEVTHITKFFGDWYLAQVYLGASERFHLKQWRDSVEDRLGQLDQLYNVVSTEINNGRMTLLEVLIVIFFAIDLLALFFK